MPLPRGDAGGSSVQHWWFAVHCPQERTHAAPASQAATCSQEQQGAAEAKCLGKRGRQGPGRACRIPGLASRPLLLEGGRRGKFLFASSGASMVKDNLNPCTESLNTFSLKLWTGDHKTRHSNVGHLIQMNSTVLTSHSFRWLRAKRRGLLC